MLNRLAAEHATGVLVRERGTLYLSEGRVVHAESPATPGIDVLLTAAGAVDPEGWQRAVEGAEADPERPVSRTLISQGVLSQGQLELCHLGSLFDAAYFALAPSSAPGHFRYGAGHWMGAVRPVPVSALERETMRRRSLLNRIWPDPSTDTAPLTLIRPVRTAQICLRRQAILDLVDGRRTATDIARELGRPAFHTLVDLRRLAAAGLVAATHRPASPVPPADADADATSVAAVLTATTAETGAACLPGRPRPAPPSSSPAGPSPSSSPSTSAWPPLSSGFREADQDPAGNAAGTAPGNTREVPSEAGAEPRWGSVPVQPHGGQPSGGQPHGGQPSGGQPHGGQPSGGQPHGGQPSGGQPHGGQPSGGQPHGGQPSGGQPFAEQRLAGQPHGEQPHGEQPHREPPHGGEPHGGRPSEGQPAWEQRAGEQPYAPRRPSSPGQPPGQPYTEALHAGQPGQPYPEQPPYPPQSLAGQVLPAPLLAQPTARTRPDSAPPVRTAPLVPPVQPLPPAAPQPAHPVRPPDDAVGQPARNHPDVDTPLPRRPSGGRHRAARTPAAPSAPAARTPAAPSAPAARQAASAAPAAATVPPPRAPAAAPSSMPPTHFADPDVTLLQRLRAALEAL